MKINDIPSYGSTLFRANVFFKGMFISFAMIFQIQHESFFFSGLQNKQSWLRYSIQHTRLKRTYKPHYHYQNFSPLANGTDLNREKYNILQTHIKIGP